MERENEVNGCSVEQQENIYTSLINQCHYEITNIRQKLSPVLISNGLDVLKERTISPERVPELEILLSDLLENIIDLKKDIKM